MFSKANAAEKRFNKGSLGHVHVSEAARETSFGGTGTQSGACSQLFRKTTIFILLINQSHPRKCVLVTCHSTSLGVHRTPEPGNFLAV